jgi:hypothetical protein
MFMLALQEHVPLPGRLIFTSTQHDVDFPYDLSVFVLNEGIIRAGGKHPIPLVNATSPVKVGEKYLALGYPGHIRGIVADKTSHPIYHIVATCQLISDRMLVLQDEISPSSDTIRFGGISGGAILDPLPDDTYSIVGIVFEGRGKDEDVEERSSANDMWVYGIPITTTWMDHILEDVKARNISLDVRPKQITISASIDGEAV